MATDYQGGTSSMLSQPHDFRDSGRFAPGADGRRIWLCATCGGAKRWAAHHGGTRAKSTYRPGHVGLTGAMTSTQAKALPRLRVVRPGETPTVPPALAEVADRVMGRAPAPQERPRTAEAEAPAVATPPWQLFALEAALEAALRCESRLAATTVVVLADAQRAIRSELHPSTIRRTPLPDVAMPPRPPVRDFPPRSPAPTGTMGEARRKMASAFRSDRLRKLFIRALENGWTPTTMGNGHIRLTGPEGGHFSLSTTSDGGGRSYANDRANAKRAGLDTSGL